MGLRKDGRLTEGSGSFTGEKIAVAVIDSGIELSKDLQEKRVLAFYDYTQNGAPLASVPYDDYGHGTHVASLIAARAICHTIGFRAWQRRRVSSSTRCLTVTAPGIASHVIAAIDHAVAHRADFGITLINLSLGHPIMESATTDPLVRAVERAVAAGIVVVASAGNHGTNAATGLVGYGGITVPGNAPSGHHRRRHRHQRYGRTFR